MRKPFVFGKLWHDLTGSEVKEHQEEPNGEGFLTVKAMYSLVSLGTERLLLTQKLANETYEKMKVPYSEGVFGERFTYGYSMVGRVVDGPENLKEKNVHFMYPHQEMAFVKPTDVFPIPELDDVKVATLASNMETAVNAIWDSGYSLGDKVLIIGYGTIGALLATVLNRFIGGELSILEKDPFRYSQGKTNGFNVYNDPGKLPQDFDIVFNASGHQEGLQLAIQKVGFECKIVELSWYGSTKVNLNLGDRFHYNRLKIISSQVSNIPAKKASKWNFKSRKELVFKLLKELDLSQLITREVQFSEAPAFYEELRQGNVKDIGVVIKYGSLG